MACPDRECPGGGGNEEDDDDDNDDDDDDDDDEEEEVVENVEARSFDEMGNFSMNGSRSIDMVIKGLSLGPRPYRLYRPWPGRSPPSMFMPIPLPVPIPLPMRPSPAAACASAPRPAPETPVSIPRGEAKKSRGDSWSSRANNKRFAAWPRPCSRSLSWSREDTGGFAG